MTEAPPGGEEMRAGTRATVEVPVRLQFVGSTEFAEGFTANLSSDGMFVEAASPQPIGTLARFQLEATEAGGRVEGMAEVLWIRVRREGATRPAGMGLRFRFVEEEGREILDRLMTEAEARGKVAVAPKPEAALDRFVKEHAPEPPPRRRPSPPPAAPPPQPKKGASAAKQRSARKPTKSRAAKAKPKPGQDAEEAARKRRQLILVGVVWAVLLLLLWRLV